MIKTRQLSQGILQIFAILFLSVLLIRCKKDAVTPVTNTTKITADTTVASLPTTVSLPTIDSYNLTNSLPAGYVTDGSIDYTSYIQAALNKHTNVTFPAFPLMINDAGLIVGSNANLTFLSGSKLVLKPTANGNYNIIRILNASNVTLTNPVIVGDRYSHLGTTGEWGQGIGIYASSNVTITNANITNCWGDGIMLGSKGGVNNYNIKISNAYCVKNRRNGISVTSVVGLVLDAPYTAYCDGTSPFTGIDFEPNLPTDEMQNITANNVVTENNTGNGISIGLRNLYGGSDKTIGLTINNHIDKGSAVAFRATASLTRRKGSETVTGDINVISPSWRKNATSPIQTALLSKTIKLAISKPSVESISGALLNNSSVLSLLTYKTNINSDANYVITF